MKYFSIMFLIIFSQDLFAGDDLGEYQLKIIPVRQYNCLYKDTLYQHYYYTSQERPEIGPPDRDIHCHNVENLGPIDRPTYPRLDMIPQAFHLWDKTDPRFSDTDRSGKLDINEIIEEKLLKRFGISAEVDYFVSLNWANGPVGEIPNLGKMMRVFVNPQTGRGKCPTQNEYDGEDPSFKILGQLIGLDTEALYIALREENEFKKDDVMLIRQSLLEQIWWYEEDGHLLVPDAVTAGQKTLHFYYPPDLSDPFNQKSYQELYTVSDRRVLSDDDTAGGLSSYDKRFGCVPKISSND